MDIQVSHNFMLVSLLQILHQLSDIVRLGHQFLVWGPKESVDVSANEGAPCVSYCDSISIDHRYNFEYALLS